MCAASCREEIVESLNPDDARVVEPVLRQFGKPVLTDFRPCRNLGKGHVATVGKQADRYVKKRSTSFHNRSVGNLLPSCQVTVYRRDSVAFQQVRIREKPIEILTRNIAALVSQIKRDPGKEALSQRRKRVGISPKSWNNLVKGRHNPTLKTLEQAAEMFHLEPWQLLLPDLSTDLALSQELKALVSDYSKSDPDGRKTISQIAAFSRTHK